MAEFKFPPGASGAKVSAPNGIVYVWDDTNGRWAIESTPGQIAQIVKIGANEPSGVEGDLWYNTSNPNKHDLYVYISGVWEQAAPGKQEYDDLVDRIALLEETSEIINQYECSATHTANGDLPPRGKFATGGNGVLYIKKIRLNRIDMFQNPLSIIHDGDGLEILHEENGHSFRYKITSAYEGPEGSQDQVIETEYIGGHNDSMKVGDHYLFKFHTPSSSTDSIAHLEKDQTFTGDNAFSKPVTIADGTDDDHAATLKQVNDLIDTGGDGNDDNVALLDANQTFTGSNVFSNKTYLKSDDDTHRLYMRDKDNNTNLTIFPTGNITSNGNIRFSPQSHSTFNDRYGSSIRVDTPPEWTSGDGDFGFYIDISRGNTSNNRFVVGGRASRQKAFEVYDDGAGRMRVYGSARIDNDLQVYGELIVEDECNFREDVHVYGAQNSPTTSLVANNYYLITNIDLTANNAFAIWYSAGALSLQLGAVFKCIKTTNLPAGNKGAELLTKPDLQVAHDIYCGEALYANDIEAHTFMFDGHGDFKADVIFEDVVTFDKKVTAEDIKVNGLLDVSTASHSNNGALPKSYFTKILKEFNNDFKSIYINHGTNGTSDPPIEIKASTGTGNLIQCRNSSNSIRWGVSVHSGYMFGGTSATPWLPTSDHHFAVKKYVDNQVNTVENKIQTSSGPTGMWFKFGGDSTSLSQGQFILNGNRLIFDTYNDDGLLWMSGVTSEGSESSIWSHCSIYRQNGNTFVLDRMFQLEKMRVGTTFSNRRSLNFTKIYQKYGSGLPSVGTRYLISCGGFF